MNLSANNLSNHHGHGDDESAHLSPVAGDSCKQIPLDEWIIGAFGCVGEDEKVNNILSSPAYLTSALKIAHSLADQVGQLPEGKDQEKVSGHSRSDIVTIYINQSGKNHSSDNNHGQISSNEIGIGQDIGEEKIEGEGKGLDEVVHHDDVIIEFQAMMGNDDLWADDLPNDDNLPNDNDRNSFADELPNDGHSLGSDLPNDEHLFDDDLPDDGNLFGDDDFELEIEKNERGDIRLASNPPSPAYFSDEKDKVESCAKKEGNESDETIEYLNVSCARLGIVSRSGKQQDEKMQVYSLGLVFFKLFSGGISAVSYPASSPPLESPTLATAMNIIEARGEDVELVGDSHIKQAKKQRATVEEISMSVELLKSLGLPISLCDLIGNMIDCSRGDFSEDETYSSMVDVKKDLEFMLEYPDIYLRDLNLKEACAIGFQNVDARMFGRDMEFAKLKEVYLRSVSKESELCCAIICGSGGIGKTKLSQELVHFAMTGDGNGQDGCILISGKFDKLQQSQPFSVISTAFNNYCDWLSRPENASVAEKISKALKRVLHIDVHALSRLMPNLSKIIGDIFGNESGGFDDGAQKRLSYILCQFLEIICRHHESPVILWLDDLQWADSASIALINRVMMVSNRFFFLGCCRSDEMAHDHDLWNMLNAVSDFGVNTTKIELDCIDKDSVNLLISQKLNVLPRLTRPLGDVIFHKTQGCPFFVGQLMMMLSKEGLLCPSLTRCRWVWDEELVSERELPDDIVKFIINSLNRLPREVISSLCILACFGASSDCSMIEKLQDEVEKSLSGPLDIAVSEGYLDKKDNTYSFVHDRVLEAAYDTMTTNYRIHCHLKCGMLLSTVAERDHDNALLLIAVGQINMGGPSAVSDDKQKLRVANLNRSAGKISIGMSDFLSAFRFFDNGMSYLKNSDWENDNYELSLDLHNGAARCAIINGTGGGDHTAIEILSRQVLHHARCLEDKLDILLIKMKVLLHKSKLPAAIEHGFDVLSQLGEMIPNEITPDLILRCLEDTNAILSNISDEDLMNYRVIHDRKKEIAIQIMARISEAQYQISPSDQPMVVLKMVQLSLKHGLSPLSPLAFSLYAYFIASTGDIHAGYRFAKISKALLDKFDGRSNQIVGEVYAYTTQIMAHVEPIQSVVELHIQGQEAAMKTGSAGAFLNYLFNGGFHFWSGAKLSKTESSIRESMIFMKQHQNLMLYAILMPTLRTVCILHGTPFDTVESDSNHESSLCIRDIEEELRLTSPAESKRFYVNKMLIAFIFREFDDARKFALKYSQFKIPFWTILFHQCMHTFYEGLVSFWIGREEDCAMWITWGSEAKLSIQTKLLPHSKWNFENKVYLLSAEEQYCRRDFDLAEELYDRAILSAREHRFVNEEALANELAAFFYLETGRKKRSLPYFLQAIEKYHEWEAYAKVKSLESYVEEMFT